MKHSMFDTDLEGDTSLAHAKIAAASRIYQERKFASNAQSPEELHERISLIAPNVRKIVADVVEEFGVTDKTAVLDHAFALLRTADEHDHSQQKTENLPSSTTGLSDVGSPKIDLGPDKDLPPIDAGSVRNRLEHQNVSDKPNKRKWQTWPEPGPMEKTVDITTPIGEEQVGDRTDVWTQAQNDPVTDKVSSVEDNYRIVE